MASEIRVDKINSLSGVGTVTLSPTGVDISGITTVSTLKVGTGVTASEDGDIFFTGIATATTFVGNLTGDPTGSGANLTALPAGQLTGTVADARISTLTASKLSGALPAISALNLTNVPAANVVGVHTSLNITGSTTVGGGITISESGIEASGIGITVANINGSQIGGRRNLIINGAMQVAQRGTSYTGANSYNSLDRVSVQHSGLNEDVTSSQSAVASGTSPYAEGFRNAFKITNGNQSGGAGSSDYLYWWTILEAQDIANSGWNYTSPSSFITISFWIKSSVAQNFYGFLQTADGTSQSLAYETGSLTADTWTKIVKTIPGNANLQFDNNANAGLYWAPARIFDGTDRTGSLTLDTWGAYNSGARTPDATSTFYTTNDATIEWTGLQMEVGSQATAFEHRSFGEELLLCQRYYFKFLEGNNKEIGVAWYYLNNHASFFFQFPTTMRAVPTGTDTTGGSYYTIYRVGGPDTLNSITFENGSTEQFSAYNSSEASGTAGQAGLIRSTNASAKIEFSAEL